MKIIKRAKSPKKKKKKKRRPKSVTTHNLKNWLLYLPIIGPPIITAFIYMWLHTRMNIVDLTTEELRAKKRDLIRHTDSIQLRIEQLQAPERIESIAREKLKMILPHKWQVVPVDESTQPPVAIERSGQVQKRLPPDQRAAGLFGFLEKRAKFGSTSLKHSPPEVSRQSG